MTGDETKRKAKVAVRDLAEFALRSGDLYHRAFGGSSAREGIIGHQRLQKSRGPEYQAEVAVRHVIERDDFSLEIGGRIDGIFTDHDPPTIEEIKTTRMDFEDIPETMSRVHLGQAMLYARLYALEQGLERIAIQLTYVHVDTHETDEQREIKERHELEAFFDHVVEIYLTMARQVWARQTQRDASLQTMTFPHETFRQGQRRFAAEVYRTIRDGGNLMIQAPTGIGKTMATLFPALKNLGEGHIERIFFLTAKTVGRGVAERTLALLRASGVSITAITLTAKKKVCRFDDTPCDPEECLRSRGYYDRLRPAIDDIFNEQALTREKIADYAARHQLCPFEFSLDLAVWADIVIGDYNYAFDPAARLRRFFSGDKQPAALLIDEAHNMVDRARAMFSADLIKSEVLAMRRQLSGRMPEVARALGTLNRRFLDVRKLAVEAGGECVLESVPDRFSAAVHRFCQACDAIFVEAGSGPLPEAFLEFYFRARRFLRTMEYLNAAFAVICRGSEEKRGETSINIFNLDPSGLIRDVLGMNRATVFFSATLTPFIYFTRLLVGTEGKVTTLALPSPFDPTRQCSVIAHHIATRYRVREASYGPIASLIQAAVRERQGNYLVYLPSYRYLRDVYDRFIATAPDVETLIQDRDMDDRQRDHFLEAFSDDRDTSLVGFAVMGGAFGEGIDLVGERLIGVFVVGVGLPMVCLERNLIRRFF